MVLICVKLADKITIKKITFLYTDMPDNSFLGAFSYSFYFVGAIFGLLFAGLWIDEKFVKMNRSKNYLHDLKIVKKKT